MGTRSGGDGEAISAKKMASSLEKKMPSYLLKMSPKCCIFETPKILSRHNERAYVPNGFSIGPFHFQNPNLKSTETIKYKYLNGLINRLTNRPGILRELIESVNEVENEARECYAGKLNCTKEEFVEMLVVDGCFLIELFRKDNNLVSRDEDDPVFTMSCIPQFLQHDLILLENQIPWLVLDLLFEKTKEGNDDSKSLVQLTLDYFSNMFSSEKSIVDKTKVANSNHILDLLRNWLIVPFKHRATIRMGPQDGENQVWQTFPSATEIRESGIRFKKHAHAESILHIRFDKGTLYIPNLLIQETTETILRNLVSYEQCLMDCPPIVTCYAILLDNLINTTKDLKILIRHEIIDNWLNPEDATQFFSKLYVDAYVQQFYYFPLCHDVKVYRKKYWPRWRAAYVHNYFSTPWIIASQIVAGMLLVLTFLQTLYSIMPEKEKC